MLQLLPKCHLKSSLVCSCYRINLDNMCFLFNCTASAQRVLTHELGLDPFRLLPRLFLKFTKVAWTMINNISENSALSVVSNATVLFREADRNHHLIYSEFFRVVQIVRGMHKCQHTRKTQNNQKNCTVSEC